MIVFLSYQHIEFYIVFWKQKEKNGNGPLLLLLPLFSVG